MSKHIFWGLSGWLILASFQAGLSAQSLSDTTEIIRLKWVNFSPYTEPGQNPELGSVIPESQIMALLDTLKPWVAGIRTFDTQNGLEKVPCLAKERGFKVIVGIWLDTSLSANAISIAHGIAIAKTGCADRVIVGSEVLRRNNLEADELIAYINQVKQAIPDSIPVSCADIYQQLLSHPEVVAACDFVAPNIYPFWEGVPIACAMPRFHEAYRSLLKVAAGKEIFISESGWKSDGLQHGDAEPSLENAIRYNRELLGWSMAMGTDVNIFSAFDEPWKLLKNDGGWGIFYNDATLKPGMDTLFKPFGTIDSTWLCKKLTSSEIDTLSFDFVPVIGSSSNIKGHINHYIPCDYRIVTYIKVNGFWWIKPTCEETTARILCDGKWTVDYTTGGSDSLATDICVFLVPVDYTPPPCGCFPLIGGCEIIPSEVYKNAISWKCVERCFLSSAAISVSAEAICRGDTSILTGSGGTTYLWSTITGDTTSSVKVSPTKTTDYIVTITDGANCGVALNQTIQVLTPVPFITINLPLICLGDTSILTAYGGTNYLWNTSDTTATTQVSPTTTTTYIVTVTNAAGCTETASAVVFLDIPPYPAYSIPDSICVGASSTVVMNGGASYLWNTGQIASSFQVTPTTTTTYIVTVTSNNGCTSISQTTLTVNPLPATPSISADTNCVLTCDVLLPNGTYLWQINGQIIGSNAPYLDAKVYGNGIYTVQITDENGCVAISPLTPVGCVSAAHESDSICPLKIYPNPSTGRFTVSLKSDEVKSVEILCNNLLGQAIFRKEYNLANGVIETELDLSAVAKGVYIIQVRSNGKSVYRKVIFAG